MVLSQEQIKELKNQLSMQINHLPLEQKEEAQKQIDEMSPDALESMLEEQKARGAIFRKIASKEVDAKILDENEEAIAVLEIRPLTKGHTIIIPKKRIEQKNQIPDKMKELTNKISDKLKSALQAKDIIVETDEKFGEIITDVIPVYEEKVDKNAERHLANGEELNQIYNKIKNFQVVKNEVEKEVIKKDNKKDLIKIKRRIP